MQHFEVVVVGAGIVGLAVAREILQQERCSLLVLEAESEVGRHQTGNNSGVIHSGLYYRPGSLKAELCGAGREALLRFCDAKGIRYELCGKLVIAADPGEMPALQELQRRGEANGLEGLRALPGGEIRAYEPRAAGHAALWVPTTGIVDYGQVAAALAEEIEAFGGCIGRSEAVQRLSPVAGGVDVSTPRRDVRARRLVACAGLYADRVARLAGLDPGVHIVPFRGEYHELVPARAHLVRNLIYPVPDPRFPFLGVHFTRRIQGGIEAGPNAVLTWKRTGYRKFSFSARDAAEILTDPGFWRLARRYFRTGLAEIHRSLHRPAFVRALQRLVPDLRPADVVPRGAGVRAQALDRSGHLIDDFRIVHQGPMVHVLNAPSPAATSALAIARVVASKARAGGS